MEIYVDWDSQVILFGYENTKNYCLDSDYAGFYNHICDNYSEQEVWNFTNAEKEEIVKKYIKETFGYRKIN